MSEDLKDRRGRKYKVGSLVRIERTYAGLPLTPFKGHIIKIEEKIVTIRPIKQDFDRYVSHDEIIVIKYN